MNVFQGAILGIVQGVTEFLPVSSSGHLVLVKKIMGVSSPLSFEIALHAATLLAVVAVMWKDVWGILRKPFSKLTGLILAACIPSFLIGFFFQDLIESIFQSGKTLGLEFMLTGAALLLAENLSAKKRLRNMGELGAGEALFIGTAQGLAILPAISRSGFTMAAGLMTGLRREEAVRFSFLLSIPVIAGAALFDGLKWLTGQVDLGVPLPSMAAGLMTAGISGYIAARWMLRIFTHKGMRPFAFYVFAMGILSLALILTGVI
ncbi:MAG TPA: undecaprenyl-diphosphatase [Clostridiales bacterium]|nr:undecaprenyl-diphosphatase [Clostridiales bacterium]